jgi:hypothetical protein
VREALTAVEEDRARVIPGWIAWTLMLITALVPIFVLRIFPESSRAQFQRALILVAAARTFP